MPRRFSGHAAAITLVTLPGHHFAMFTRPGALAEQIVRLIQALERGIRLAKQRRIP